MLQKRLRAGSVNTLIGSGHRMTRLGWIADWQLLDHRRPLADVPAIETEATVRPIMVVQHPQAVPEISRSIRQKARVCGPIHKPAVRIDLGQNPPNSARPTN